MPRLRWVECEAGAQQSFGNNAVDVAKRTARWPFLGDDLEVDVFRHAPEQAIVAAQGGSATEHQAERSRLRGSNRRKCLYDIPVLLDECWARQSETLLNLQQLLERGLIVQER